MYSARGGNWLSGAHRFIAIVNTPQCLKFFLLETLDADGQSIDPQLAVRHELLLFEGAGVGFQRDLDIAGKRDARFHTFEQAAQRGGAEQARRAAAKEDRTQLTAIHCVQILVQIGEQGVDVFVFGQYAGRPGGYRHVGSHL